MPNKYSHSVVLAHYSSLGLIDLPNDQYITYLKTYPTSKPSSTTSGSRGHGNGAHGSLSPSRGHSARRTGPEQPVPGSRSVTGCSQHSSSTRRNIIIESDEGSADEGVVLHKTYQPVEPEPQPEKKAQHHDPQLQNKKKLPSVSPDAGHSSSEVSERISPTEPRQQLPLTRERPTRSPPSIINLNEFEGVTAKSENKVPPSSARKPNHICAQVRPAVEKTLSLTARDTGVYSLNPHEDLNFDGFSDRELSDVTITTSKKGYASSSSAIPRSQFAQTSASDQLISPLSGTEVSLPNRGDSGADINGISTKSKQTQLRQHRSFESISSMNSDDMVHLTTALPPVLPQDAQTPKPLRLKPRKIGLPSTDAAVDEDVIDPSFFETLRGGPKASSASPSKGHFSALRSVSPASPLRPSLQSSRHSSDPSPPHPDFWRGLEDMLSDSDSAVFPPDIVKYKPRDNNVLPTAKADKPLRNDTEEREVQRPTTAPAPRTSSRAALSKEGPLPEARSKTNFTADGSLDKARVAREKTTVQLVNISAQQQETSVRKGFLRKLRKKSYNVKKA